MTVLLILVPLALTLGLGGLACFMWCMRNGQYDDLEGASLRVLSDDDLPPAARPDQRG
ncbi:cbb3-type cytochrome oxidase maturation protein [Pseudochelatococcus lubricantis]|uniref:Cbb3-type cytochrome oxidase maturation protein n=1 Tax=Pseudochelatococcus lubricantis TaxID=1538102 RepID=A0ABX0UXP6_9HYPH|nr:cbb3-type cytochrome oxidase assembly protein CcoS [Pseudochelatococcus lubricantis]NIJ57716.1 cbb3-type cytochrome oxidase maturation protein [Pseudochelatococcus lubricantis]